MDLDALKANLKKDFQGIVSQEELNQLKVKYLGKKGQIAANATHLYICVATDTWRRVALSTF